MDTSRIIKCTGFPKQHVEDSWPKIVAALGEFGIDSENTQIAAAATVAVESFSFLPTKELHADRAKQPALWALQERYWPSGFYGRGFIQLTWRSNYEKVDRDLGINLLQDPDLALEPVNAARILAWFFKNNSIPQLADMEKWEQVRHKVNGGSIGMKEFLDIVSKLKA